MTQNATFLTIFVGFIIGFIVGGILFYPLRDERRGK